MAKAQQSYIKPLVLAVAEGATTPNPGITGVVVLSSTTGSLMRWGGSAWTTAGGASTGVSDAGAIVFNLMLAGM